ncbi:DUF3224 domain-containing protein [Lentilitoribacter sp. Alg239-R112]|uniref:DUF3224 domain-containing protein n=1 Tax=Lentilitoribacter sp. Alg239-R112 TaxID=2305987 RepID=UPI0013A69B5B|nr:DUF3224 domain-containing protein [Lentilitoribacter sp. Alg239-R112]
MEYKASFTIEKWSEDKITKMPEPQKFNRGEVIRKHKGYVHGKETMHYTLIYANERRSEFSGIGLFEGHIGEEKGHFIIIERGSYQNGSVDVKFDVQKINSNGEFGPVLGQGSYNTSEHQNIEYIFRNV